MRTVNERLVGGTRCFTLVEMMLVIMIMVICAAILMPILTRLPKYAQEVACINNMRQIAIGYKTYMIDNNNKFPNPVFWLDDFRPAYKYINNLGVFACPGSRHEQAQSESDLGCDAGSEQAKANPYIPSKVDYYTSGTIADIELQGNYNNGFGNNPYSFDPSNKQAQAYLATKILTRRVIFERRHCNHPTFRTSIHMTHRLNVMYIDEVQHVFNTWGMAEYCFLNSDGKIAYKDTVTNPWWPTQPIE